MAAIIDASMPPTATPISRPEHSHFRWTVCALLFFATTISYVDRQVLSLLAKTLEVHIGWTADEYGSITSAFSLDVGCDAAGVARPTPGIAWTLWRAGIPLRIGTGYRAYSFLFNERVMEHRSDARRHELEYNLQLLRPLGIEVPETPVEPSFGISVDPTRARNLDAILASFGIGKADRLVVLHPGSGNSARDWPVNRFSELGMSLANAGIAVVASGTAADERKLHALRVGMKGRVISLAGLLDLPMLAALLARTTVFVANSTGPLHLAVAMGTRVVSFYPPVRVMSARRWGPYRRDAIAITGDGPEDCRKCRRGMSCACVKSITLESAMIAVKKQLDQAGNQQGWL